MKTFLISLMLILTTLVVGCSKKEQVSFDTLESSRVKAKENATWNAVQFRANDIYANYSIDALTDSTMDASCPQGDGWASVKLVNNDNPREKIPLKCSTVSNAIGCLRDEVFKTKTFAGDDGTCQPIEKVPFPLPTLKK